MWNSRAISLLVGAVALAVFVVSLWLMRTSPEAQASRAAVAAVAPAAAPPSVTVDAWVARRVSARVGVEVSGVLAPVRAVSLGAEVAGKVVEVAVEEHATVAAGAVIVRLDQALPRAALAQAEANLALARATLRQADAELRRQKDLASRGIASVVELERVEADASRAAAEVARARAQVLDAATRLDKTTIVAPFAALVSSFDLEPGAYVSPGQSVAELLDLSELEIEFGVGDREIGALRAGQTASIRVDVFPAESFSGVIHRVGRAPDARTQRYPIPVRVADPSGRLLPGMLATVRLEIGEAVSVLRVPRRAVRTEFDLSYLFAIVGDTPGDGDGLGRGRVVRHRVATRRVPFRPELVDVIRGLDDGSRIAVTGVADLRDGMEVRYRDREISL